LVHRAATAFLKKSGMTEGVCIHLDKRIPLAAGLGGGSSNAATTLLALNDLFDAPLTAADLCQIAAALGSDVPFFLQSKPALATGRGERITPLENFPALHGVHLLLIYPGFGVSTAWAYQQLARYPNALNGRPGRAQQLIELLQTGRLAKASGAFYNALEAPVLAKFPLLALFQEFLRQRGAIVALMSGSGSATFALLPNRAEAERMRDEFNAKFGNSFWTAVVPI
jgi:4-diphosphocytidyl-2-C-methyl-D-erythritol kinase